MQTHVHPHTHRHPHRKQGRRSGIDSFYGRWTIHRWIEGFRDDPSAGGPTVLVSGHGYVLTESNVYVVRNGGRPVRHRRRRNISTETHHVTRTLRQRCRATADDGTHITSDRRRTSNGRFAEPVTRSLVRQSRKTDGHKNANDYGRPACRSGGPRRGKRDGPGVTAHEIRTAAKGKRNERPGNTDDPLSQNTTYRHRCYGGPGGRMPRGRNGRGVVSRERPWKKKHGKSSVQEPPPLR